MVIMGIMTRMLSRIFPCHLLPFHQPRSRVTTEESTFDDIGDNPGIDEEYADVN